MCDADRSKVVKILLSGFMFIILSLALAAFFTSCQFLSDDDGDDEIEVGVKKEKNHLQLDYSHVKPKHEKSNVKK